MTSDRDPTAIFRFFTEVGVINQLISAKLESFLPGRMTATQFGILSHLSRRPDGETPLHLARAFQVPKTTMTHMLSGLETAGLIVVAPNEKDKRSKIVRITPQGGAFLGARMQEIGQSLGPIMQGLGMEPFTMSLPHLERIREALDTERDGQG